MSPERAQLYDNAQWLAARLAEWSHSEQPVEPAALAAVADLVAHLVGELRSGERAPRKRRSSWERALERHHLAIVRDA